METAVSAAARTEDASSARIRIEDQEAFAALYERYFDGVFDFALRVVRSRDLATAVMRKTFSKESASVRELYLTARDRALEELRYRRPFVRRGQEREGFDFTQIDAERLSDPSAVLFDRALIELVWNCAAAMSPDNYALLDLHVRRGLRPKDLDESELRLSRLRDTFEDTASATLLAARARHMCKGLDATATLRAVRQHAGACRVCHEKKRRFVSSLEVFRSLAPIPPTHGLRESLRKQIEPRSNGR